MNRPIQKIQECISPLNWLFMSLVVFPAIWIVFRPSWSELALLVGVDFMVTYLYLKLDRSIFLRRYPDTRAYFDGFDTEQVRHLSTSARLKLLASAFRFPTRRALHCYIYSFVKCIPAFAIMIYVWDYPHSAWAQLGLMLGLCSINWIYFFCMVLIDNHDLMSRWITRLHEACDLSDAFALLDVKKTAGLGINTQEWLLLGFLFLSTLTLQLIMVISGTYGSGIQLATHLAAAGLVGLVLFSRAWFISRVHFTDRLAELHRRIEEAENLKIEGPIPLSTLPLVALFGQAINRLRRRIRDHERELSTLVLRQAEKSRFRDIGEMAALLAHDLSGPLHVAQFSATQLLEEPDMSADRRKTYLLHLVSSLGRAVEQTTTLRSRIRNPESGGRSVRFGEAHDNVLNILKARMTLSDFAPIHFKLDEGLRNLVVAVPRVDLIHILDNLYRNSAEVLTESGTPTPEVRVSLRESGTPSLAEITIRDNGPGLSATEFDRMTAFHPIGEIGAQGDATRGIGLRLTRRLVEVNGGDLQVVTASHLGAIMNGTTLRLTLPLAEPTSPDVTAHTPGIKISNQPTPSSKNDPLGESPA